MTTRRLLTLGAIATLAFGATSCSPKDAGTPDATPATQEAAPSDGGGGSAATSPTTESAPEIPAPDPADFPGKDERTEEGAKQAFAFYWATAITANQTGKVDALQTLGRSDCIACNDYIESITQRIATGNLWPTTSIETNTLEMSEDPEYDHVVLYEFTATQDSDNTSERATYVTVGALEWEGQGWKVVEYAIEKSEPAA